MEGEAGLLSQVQRGFQALMDGEAYVQQRANQLSGRPAPSAESLVDKVCSTLASLPTAANSTEGDVAFWVLAWHGFRRIPPFLAPVPMV